MNWKEMRLGYLRSAIVGLLIILNIAEAIYYVETAVANYAHAGGCLVGLLLGVVVLKNFRKYKYERVLFWISLTIFLVLLGIGVILNVAYIPCKSNWTALPEYILSKWRPA